MRKSSNTTYKSHEGYSEVYRPQPMRSSSNTTQKDYEGYFSGRRKMFNDKKSEKQRVVDSIRSDNKSNSAPNNKLKVSNPFASLLKNQTHCSCIVFYLISRHALIKRKQNQPFFLPVTLIWTIQHQRANLVLSI